MEAADKLKPAFIKSSRSFFIVNLSRFKFPVLVIPFITIVISPITSLALNNSLTWLISFPTCSSNFFVNSLATTISLSPPQNSNNSSNNFLTLLGDS